MGPVAGCVVGIEGTDKGTAGDGTASSVDGCTDGTGSGTLAGICPREAGRVGGNGVAEPVGDCRRVDAEEPWTDEGELATDSSVDGPRIGGSIAIMAESGGSSPGAAAVLVRAVEEGLLCAGAVGRIAPSAGKSWGFGKPEVTEREENAQKSVQPMAGDLTAI